MQFESARGQVRAIATMFLAFVLTFAVSVPLAPAWAGQGGELEAASGVQLQSASSSSSKLTSSQLNAFKKASADFSIDLFGRCVADKGKNSNVTIAPMSVMNALAITANGAGGSTLKQMRDVLGDGASMASINEGLSWYNSKLVNVEKAKLKSANAIWYHKDGTLKMKKKFLSTARTTYNAKVTGADFKLQKTVDSINSWVAKQTNNMIKKVIDNLGADDRIVIVNALSFDAIREDRREQGAVHQRERREEQGRHDVRHRAHLHRRRWRDRVREAVRRGLPLRGASARRGCQFENVREVADRRQVQYARRRRDHRDGAHRPAEVHDHVQQR